MNVAGAARRKPYDPAHRPRRIDLCHRDPRYGRERGSARGQMQKLPAGKFHFEPPFTSFDHLVGDGEQLVRHVNAERSSGLEINHQLKLDRLLDRQVVRFGTLENLPDIMEAHLAKEAPANTIAHQAAVKDGS